MPRKCKLDDARSSRDYYQQHKDDPEFRAKRREIVNRSKQKNRDYRDSMKKPCIICGEDDPVAIDFHHPEDDKHQKGVGYISQHGSFKALKEEIAKCVCLCANCHRKVHHGNLSIP